MINFITIALLVLVFLLMDNKHKLESELEEQKYLNRKLSARLIELEDHD